MYTSPLSSPDSSVVAAAPRRVNPAVVSLCVACGLLAAVAGVGAARAREATRRAEQMATRFAPGVRVAGISVGGETRDKAAADVRAWAQNELGAHAITLVAPQSKKRFTIPLTAVGARYDTAAALDAAFAVGKKEDLWARMWRASSTTIRTSRRRSR